MDRSVSLTLSVITQAAFFHIGRHVGPRGTRGPVFCVMRNVVGTSLRTRTMTFRQTLRSTERPTSMYGAIRLMRTILLLCSGSTRSSTAVSLGRRPPLLPRSRLSKKQRACQSTQPRLSTSACVPSWATSTRQRSTSCYGTCWTPFACTGFFATGAQAVIKRSARPTSVFTVAQQDHQDFNCPDRPAV